MAVKNYRIYQERRRRLAKNLGKNGIIFVFGARTTLRNADTEYPFRQESGFLYLTGFAEPNALLIITGGKKPRSILFCDPKKETEEIWTGKRFGPEGAKKEFGFQKAFSNDDAAILNQEFTSLLHERRVIYCPQHEDAILLSEVNEQCFKRANGDTLQNAGEIAISRAKPPLFLDGNRMVGEMRLIKDTVEIATMARAAEISANAHREILSLVRPGMTEVELETEYTYRFRKAGGDPCHAYPPIVAAGVNACTLHHTSTDTRIQNDDLVLVDAGCEYKGYASDITRTFPANGKFTREQLAVYEIVLAAQKAAILAAKPGQPLHVVHDVATRIICEGLMELELLKKNDPTEASSLGAHLPFFPHGTSHWLGLDVHDAGDYINWNDGKARRILEPGMVITVEPGIYIQPNLPNIDQRWLGIGIRIEDDVLITPEGNRVLSSGAPKTIEEIEGLMTNA